MEYLEIQNMKIDKHGQMYRVRKRVKGKSYTLLFDTKPSEKDILIKLAEEMTATDEYAPAGSVKYYAKAYIVKLRKDGRSSTTLNSYSSIITNTPEWFLLSELKDVTSESLSKCIREYSATRSPKSVANFYGFYRSVLADFRPNSTFKVKLPKREKKYQYEPSTKDIKAILEYTKGTEYELFLRLASIGLRRGEIGALSSKDLSNDNILTINKDMVRSENKVFVIKNHPKTSASNRRILIPSDIADMLRNKGQAYAGNLDTVNKYLGRVQQRLDIPKFRLHIMRHFASAYLVKNGFTKEQVLEYMGWEKGSTVMERVYSYNLDPEESQKDIADAFKSLA